MSGPSASPFIDPIVRARVQLARVALPMLVIVLIQFLLGMGLNLYVTLPTGSGEQILASSPLLIAHFLVAFLVIGISIRAVFLSSRARIRPLLYLTTVGLVSGIAAFLAGADFVFVSQSALASYIMSLGFVGVLIAAIALVWYRGTLIAGGPAVAATPGSA